MNERIYEKQGDTLLKPKEEIVRCKDCKWYENACTFFAADPFERAPMEKNDFCSYGERRIENLTVKLSKEQPKQDCN